MTALLNDTIVVILGVIIAEMLYDGGKHIYNRLKNKDKIKLEEFKCDLCSEPRKLVRTPDTAHHWLCETCMITYLSENDFSDFEKEKILNAFHKRPKRRGRRKK